MQNYIKNSSPKRSSGNKYHWWNQWIIKKTAAQDYNYNNRSEKPQQHQWGKVTWKHTMVIIKSHLNSLPAFCQLGLCWTRTLSLSDLSSQAGPCWRMHSVTYRGPSLCRTLKGNIITLNWARKTIWSQWRFCQTGAIWCLQLAPTNRWAAAIFWTSWFPWHLQRQPQYLLQ